MTKMKMCIGLSFFVLFLAISVCASAPQRFELYLLNGECAFDDRVNTTGWFSLECSPEYIIGEDNPKEGAISMDCQQIVSGFESFMCAFTFTDAEDGSYYGDVILQAKKQGDVYYDLWGNIGLHYPTTSKSYNRTLDGTLQAHFEHDLVNITTMKILQVLGTNIDFDDSRISAIELWQKRINDTLTDILVQLDLLLHPPKENCLTKPDAFASCYSSRYMRVTDYTGCQTGYGSSTVCGLGYCKGSSKIVYCGTGKYCNATEKKCI